MTSSAIRRIAPADAGADRELAIAPPLRREARERRRGAAGRDRRLHALREHAALDARRSPRRCTRAGAAAPSASADRAARNSSVSRTAPSGRLAISWICPPTENVSSQLPPPRSISSTRRAASRVPAITPRWISRPSSSPVMTSIFQPVAERTQSPKALAFRASRMALVATTRTVGDAVLLHGAMEALQRLDRGSPSTAARACRSGTRSRRAG